MCECVHICMCVCVMRVCYMECVVCVVSCVLYVCTFVYVWTCVGTYGVNEYVRLYKNACVYV